MAGSPDKSIIEEEDIWAYMKFIRSYEAIYAIRKQGSLLPEVVSALSSGIEMTMNITRQTMQAVAVIADPVLTNINSCSRNPRLVSDA